MDDSLIDEETVPLARRSLLPGEGFFVPDSVDEVETERAAREALEGADRVVVADPDADGLACAALVREAFGAAALLPAGPHEIDDALQYLLAFGDPGLAVFVCDLCPDSPDDLAALPEVAERAAAIRWFDHHQWDDDLAATVQEHAELVVGASEEECTADVALRTLEYDFPDRYADLAAVTRDHDLWLREDPRSDDLADYAHWADPEEYLETIQAHGADLPPAVETSVADRRVEKEALVEHAVDRAEYETVDEWTVGVTYGRCSQNEVAEAMRTAGADASVVVKPAGSASIRGTDAFERCHEVAGQVNGGGHPKAAGCKPDIYDDMLDFAHHWTTRGAVAKQVILDAFRNLETDGESARSDRLESDEG
jgi:oligoribonuclease NrnB/cAMP/cGMP phosphodiesterase (DHH superfamily)